MYILTIKSGKVTTRVQLGCMDKAFDFLEYADVCDTFHSFVKLPFGEVIERTDAEIARADSFVKHAFEFAQRKTA